jgi:parallel beta-helix repeat protein
VNKTLILRGVGSPVVDGSSTGNAITVNADGCTIQEFVARNSGSINSGIYVTSSGNTISSNTANNNSRAGIFLDYSSNGNTISDNLANGNEDCSGEGDCSDGIYLNSSSSNNIFGNHFGKAWSDGVNRWNTPEKVKYNYL